MEEFKELNKIKEIEIEWNKLPESFYEWFYCLPIAKRKKGNNGGKSKKNYIDIVSAFDIETTRISSTTKQDRDNWVKNHRSQDPPADYTVMYIWQWCFMLPDYSYICVYGREWPDFIMFYRRLTKYQDANTYLVVYVHNLAYEFQFLRGIMPFSSDDVFNTENRQPLKACSNGLEFRCSFKLSNMSLRKFAESEHCTHLKTELEYRDKRYSYTVLTPDELRYCLNDVICLCEAIINKMKQDGDTLYSIPLTSTGYVRREVKKAVHEHPQVLKDIRAMFPDLEIYQMLKDAFRGGNTHANRYYSDKLLRADQYGLIHSRDRSSSYPAVICNNLYPMSEFQPIGDLTIQNVNHHIYDLGRAVLMTVAVWHIHLSDITWGCPYISVSKCHNLQGGNFDNGRVLEADYLEMTITDVDYKIIQDEYEGDFTILKAYSAKYDRLPQCIINKVIEYYRGKTELKGVEGMEYFYMKSKNLLNSIYGMMVQDPCKDLILFVNGDMRHEESDYQPEGMDKSEILQKAAKKAFLNYAWGIWVTSWARYELERGIEIVSKTGIDGKPCEFLYCDTDSMKFIGNPDFSVYNNEKIEESKKSGSYATDPAGHIHYMGVFESENDMLEFKTMGAKKYAYTDNTGLHITVAGVGKKAGCKELEEAAALDGVQPIEEFNEGFIFDKAGGLEAVYNDIPLGDYVETKDSNGKPVLVISNVCLRETTYTLGITSEYRDLIRGISRSVLDDLL